MKRARPLVLALAFLSFIHPVRGGWTTGQRLSWTSGDSFRPALAVGPSGRVHLAWEDLTPGNIEIYYKRSTDGGTTWQPNQRLSWASGDSEGPAIAVGPSGTVHLVWVDYVTDNWEIVYRRSPDGGSTWTARQNVSHTLGHSGIPSIVVDTFGHLHVVWQDYTPGNPEVYYRRSTDGGASWAAVRRLTWDSGESTYPDIAVDSFGAIHVLWDDNTPGNFEIYHKKSTDGGATWTASKRLTWNSGGSYVPDAAFDSFGNLHVVWHDYTPATPQIFYRKSPDGGVAWTASRPITWTSGGCYQPAIRIDSSDGLHLIWEYYTPGEYKVYYRNSTDGGANWTTSQRLTWTAGYSAAFSFAIDPSDNLHLAWEDYISGNSEIFYRKGT